MNNFEINSIMKNNFVNEKWGGIYPSDKIPPKICKQCNFGIIINTETSKETGYRNIKRNRGALGCNIYAKKG